MAPQANEGGPTARATVVPENGQTLVNLGGGGEGGSALAELTTQEAMRFIDELSADFSPLLILSGGEPLCRPDIFEIASYAAGKGLAVALATNATLVTDDVAGKIKGSGIRRVSVSLDGPNAGVHDGFRGLPGSFDAAIAGLKQIQGVGVSTQINTTVTCHNVDFLPETLELALDFGVDAFHIFCLVPVGCGLEIADEEQISPQRYEEVLRWLFEKSLEVEIHLKATCAPHYYRIVKQLGRSGNRVAQERQGSSEEVGASPASEEGERGPEMRRSGTDRGMSAVTKGCLAGQAVCFISHTGEVFPCGYLPLSSGNIRHQRLSEIWGTSPIFESLRDPSLLKGKCGICEYRLICQGCRARAYGCTGDFLAEEPYCTYQPRSGD
jgi:radical SAM protein with 4Fe4S-binding SPASM domain